MKISKSEKIRQLLKSGMSPAAVAKKLKIPPGYVHTVKWQAKKRAERKGYKPRVVVSTSARPTLSPRLVDDLINLAESLRNVLNSIKENSHG
jgi:hypothetical protein